MPHREAYLHLIGWILFLICAVLFLAAGIRAADPLLIVGSVVFLVACVVFLIPLVSGGRREARQVRED